MTLNLTHTTKCCYSYFVASRQTSLSSDNSCLMILHIWVDHDPRRTFIDFQVKGQGQIQALSFVPFPHDNSIIFWHAIMILHTLVEHVPRKTSIDFGVKGQGQIQYFAKFLYNNSIIFWQWWYLMYVLPLILGLTLLILWVKCQGQTWKVWICCCRGYLSLLGQVSLNQL